MSFKDIEFPRTSQYSSDSAHIPLEFYLTTFPKAKKIDMVLGYFSTNAIRTLSMSFAEFIYNGGELRIATNHFLTSEDKENLLTNTLLEEEHRVIDIFKDLELLRNELGSQGQHFFDCLKYLLSRKRLTMLPVKHNENAMAHYKKILLFDGENTLYAHGSANFTGAGLIKNGESFTVDKSWSSDQEVKYRIEDESENFKEIFNKTHPSYKYLNADEVEEIIYKIGNDYTDLELLEKSFELRNARGYSLKIKEILDKSISLFEEKIEHYKNTPRFPYPEGPRTYQKKAYQNWVTNDRQGIFAMATGTGKTITSLNCLLNEYHDSSTYKAIILVPTISLLDQWKKECSKFNFKNIICINSKEKWNEKLSFFNTANKLKDTSFIVIVTYASLTRARFQSHFKNLPKETLFIADEVHNMGSPSIMKLFGQIHLERRIGLSATPNRKYDEEGNSAIDRFFNDKAPYIYSYTMKAAMENHPPALCKYTYYPHLVYLNDQELLEYIKISKQLARYMDSKTGKYKDCNEVEELLLKRKRIIHKAANKKDVFKAILKNEFLKKGNLKYSLVYVPEGVEPDYSKTDEYIEDEEDNSLINEYTRIVSNTDDSIMVKQYTAKTPNRVETIKDFESGKIHVLTSMKCLDEGVDVPRSELAIFCSSTGNPRQFIQRRGRVLRLHDDKINAVIHDLVVIPRVNTNSDNYDLERNLIKKELERVVDFSELSMNKVDTYEALKDILDYYNLTLNDI